MRKLVINARVGECATRYYNASHSGRLSIHVVQKFPMGGAGALCVIRARSRLGVQDSPSLHGRYIGVVVNRGQEGDGTELGVCEDETMRGYLWTASM